MYCFARRFLMCLLFAAVIEGCDGGTYQFTGLPDSPLIAESNRRPPPSLAAHPLHGHFLGVAQLRDTEYYAEALLTVDGAVQIYVAGPVSSALVMSGAAVPGELLISSDAALFAGDIAPNAKEGSGSGLVFGLACGDAGTDRFCEEPATADIEIAATTGGFVAKLRVATSSGDETWLLDVGEHSLWYDTLAYGPPSGLYHETLAQFALAGDVVLRIDDAGLLFFQSPDSGCTGNGTVSSHLDGEYSVWDVGLHIESCNAPYAFLNGDFDGLATVSQSGYWDYDTWLIMFLTTSEGSAPRAALVSHGEWQ